MGAWSDERVARLKELHATGMSYHAIAADLCAMKGPAISRNAAIGKAMRIGLLKRGGQQFKPTNKAPRAAKPISQTTVIHIKKPLPEEPITVAESAEASPKHISLFELTAHTCRWPYGKEAPFSFCGCEPVAGKPYCEPHVRQARGKATFGSPEHKEKLSLAAKARHAQRRAAA